MRNAFARSLCQIADSDDRVRVLVGDIGFRIFDDFISGHSDKFLNCGIAEQNMLSVAAGMASEGIKVFVYTITPFLLMRAYEQIRVDVGINMSRVVLVGVGAGIAYDKLGPTHHAYEDISLMRNIPNLDILTPYDGPSTKKSTFESYKRLEDRASYIRLSKGGEPVLDQPDRETKELAIWKSCTGVKRVIVCHGSIANLYVGVSKQDCNAYDVIALKELSENSMKHLRETLASYIGVDVVFCEEAFSNGSVFEWFMSLYGRSLQALSFGQVCLPSKYIYEVNGREVMLEEYGFALENVLSTVCT